MKNLSLTFLFLLLLLTAQTIWPAWLKPAGLAPNLILIFVVLAAVHLSPPAAVTWAIAAALAQVSFGGSYPAGSWPLGGAVVSYGLAAFIISNFLKRPLFKEMFYRMLLVFGAACVLGATKAFFATTGSLSSDLSLILVVATYSAALTPLLGLAWPSSEF